MSKPYSSRFSDRTEEQLEAEAKRRNLTASELIRLAVEAYLNTDQRQQNMNMLVERLDKLEYEILRTRSVAMRAIDPDKTKLTEELLAVAHEDVQGYLNGKEK